MTHNLPEHIRKHFIKLNKRSLEKKLDTEKLCPVYRATKDLGLQPYYFEAYGMTSNECKPCKGIDLDCEIYQDWFSKRKLRQQ